MVETGKHHGVTRFEVYCICFILHDFAEGDTSGTIMEKIANWFMKRGYSFVKSGVGWTIEV